MRNWKKSFLEGLEVIGELLSTAMVFTAIALVSWALGVLVHFMQAHGASAISVGLLQAAEYAVLAVDILGLLYRVIAHAFGKRD